MGGLEGAGIVDGAEIPVASSLDIRTDPRSELAWSNRLCIIQRYRQRTRGFVRLFYHFAYGNLEDRGSSSVHLLTIVDVLGTPAYIPQVG